MYVCEYVHTHTHACLLNTSHLYVFVHYLTNCRDLSGLVESQLCEGLIKRFTSLPCHLIHFRLLTTYASRDYYFLYTPHL